MPLFDHSATKQKRPLKCSIISVGTKLIFEQKTLVIVRAIRGPEPFPLVMSSAIDPQQLGNKIRLLFRGARFGPR